MSSPLDYLGTPQASTTVIGKVRLATVAETTAGTRADIATTPAGVAAVAIAGAPDASTTQKGIIEIATNSEAAAAASGVLALVPGNLGTVFASPPAIGGTAPAAGAFTSLSASGAFSLTGDTVTVAEGGTGASSLTDHGVMLGSGTAAVSVTAVGTTGQIFIGQTGADPVWTTNLDIPGTLDVTGVATFDDAVNVTGALTVDGLITGNASATIETAGTALNLGSDNDSAAVNLGVGTTARAIGIGSSAAAHTLTIGSTTGAASLALRAGTGNIVVSGATATTIAVGTGLTTGTITIGATGNTGTMTISNSTGTQTVNIANADGAKTINIGAGVDGNTVSIANGINTTAQTVNIANGASGANTTVNIMSGTGTTGAGTLSIGNNPRITTASLCDVAPSASRTTTVGGGTVVAAATTDTIDIGPDGATTNADSVKTVNVNTGGVTLGQVLTNIATGAVTSGTHTTAIASGNRAAGTMALNIMTGTGTKTANVGNADGLTTLNIDAITLINDSINANTSIGTGTSTGAVAIGNSAAGAITVDTAAGISLDAATASNFTVTGAGADLTLASAGGSVLMSSTEDAALAIRLHANGGTSETIQIHSDQGTGVSSIGLLSDVGGITLRATGLASADAINLEAVAGGIDMDSALLMSLTSTRDNAQAILIEATVGGIDISASGAAAGEDIDITATGSSINLTSTEATADAIVLNSSNAAGGIDLLTGGGEITISSSGNVTMAPATGTVAGTSLTINARVGVATFTGLTTASAATETLTITNSALGAGDGVFCTVSNRGSNDAQMTLSRVNTQTAGSLVILAKNNGAAALNGDLIVTFWIIN